MIKYRTGAAVVLIAAALAMAGCSSSGSAADKASAQAAASSLKANPAYQHDKTQLENELTANFKAHFNPAHPVKSTQAAIEATFPKGNADKIEAYAVKTFTPGVAHKGTTQTAWVNGVVTYALSLSALPTANVPGYVSPSPAGVSS